MPIRPIEIEGVSIVALGNFNPKIFHPIWFASEGLIQKSEGENAAVEVITQDLSSFSIGWLRVHVTRDAFSASTNQPQYYEALRDITCSTFTLLRHTPINQFGLNRLFHFVSHSLDDWHGLGHRLTPKKPWEGILDTPGMIRIVMQGKRPDQFKGQLNITVEPSGRVSPGVYVQVNDHYDLTENKEDFHGGECGQLIASQWEASMTNGEIIAQSIVNYDR
jgi:hypothetical protein